MVICTIFRLIMKKLLALTGCLILVNIAMAQADKNDACERIAHFGKAQICMPVVEGMKECYTDSVVKLIADGTEMKTNIVLGYYLTQADYSKRNTAEEMEMEEYFKVYSVKKLQDYTASASDLDKMQGVVEKSFVRNNWKELVKKIEQQYDSISIGVPTMIEKYKLDNRTITFILLVKYSNGDKEENLKLLIMNLLFLKDRLVSLGFYKAYKNEQSLKAAKEKNDSILVKFLQVNQ
jgi:hypothetical protein